MDDLRQTVALAAQHDVGQVVTRQLREVVIDHGTLAHVVVHQRVGLVGVAAALHENLAREGVALIGGQVVLDDEHDVVVVVAVAAQCLVHGEGIGLVAVVSPRRAGADDHGPVVGDGGQRGAGGRVVELLHDFLLLFPQGGGRRLGVGAAGGEIDERIDDAEEAAATLSVVLKAHFPDHIGGVKYFRACLEVEDERAGGTSDVDVEASRQIVEGSGHAGGVPRRRRSGAVAHHGTHVVGQARAVGFLVVGHLLAVHDAAVAVGHLVGGTEGDDGQRVVHLRLAHGGLAESGALKHLREAVAGRAIGRDAHAEVLGALVAASDFVVERRVGAERRVHGVAALGIEFKELGGLIADVEVERGIAQRGAQQQLPLVALTGHLLQRGVEVHALLVGHDGRELHALLGGVVREPVEERLAVVVVAIDEDSLLVAHGASCCEHDLALGDVALGEEPGVGLAGVDALQLGTGTRGHDHGQSLLPGILQERHGVARVVGADDGVAGVVARLRVRQVVGQHVEVFGVLVVVAQVQLHLLLQLGLCLSDVLLCHVDGQLPVAADAGRQHHVDIEGGYLGFLNGQNVGPFIVTAGSEERGM